MKRLLSILVVLVCAAGYVRAQCAITNTQPITVVTGGTVTIQTSGCGVSPTFTSACTGTSCQAGTINSGGVFSAPSTVRPCDYSRGVQVVPQDSFYCYPVNGLPVHSLSSLWLGRVGAPFPATQKPDHNFKLGVAPVGSLGFSVNVIGNSTATQLMHALNAGNVGPYQDTFFPFVLPPNMTQQAGFSVDVIGCPQTGCVAPDRHIFNANKDTNEIDEFYQQVYDFHSIVATPGSPTAISFTTNTIRVMQTPLRVYVEGVTGTCASSMNYTSSNNLSFLATVISPGHVTIPFNSSGCGTGLSALTISSTNAVCPICNTAGMIRWPSGSNAIVGGMDAAGSTLVGTSVDQQQWKNNVDLQVADPNCGGCVTAVHHQLRTTLSNLVISPRDLPPAVLGYGVTGSHPNMVLTNCTNGNPTKCTTSFQSGTGGLSNQNPCEAPTGYSWTIGCTFHVVFHGLTGSWAVLNGDVDYHNYVGTSVDVQNFTIPVDSTAFGTQTWSNQSRQFIFDWLPYGAIMRLKSAFDSHAWATANCSAAAAQYCESLLNTIKTYGLGIYDGTGFGDSWDSGILNGYLQPDAMLDAMTSLRNLCSNTASGCTLSGTFESNLEVVDPSTVPVFSFCKTCYQDPTNQLGTTANQRVIVTVTPSAGAAASADVNYIGTTLGMDPERITMIASPNTPSFQPTIWVNGNTNTGYSCTMSPSITGASVTAGGRVTAPNSIAATAATFVVCVSNADAQARATMEVDFVPIDGDGNIRLWFGAQQISYTDHSSNIWWGQLVNRNFNSSYEVVDGVGWATLNGSWHTSQSNWSGTTDGILYGESTSEQNDTFLRVVVPNGPYTGILGGEPGYNVNAAGQNVFDTEINGNVAESYLDGFNLAGGTYRPWTRQYNFTIAGNGLLTFVGRIRETDPHDYGMSWSNLELIPGGCSLSFVTTTLPNGTINVPYDTTLQGTCGAPPYGWSISVGNLPAGLTLNPTTGEILGTPTQVQTSPITVKLCDSHPTCITSNLSIQIFNTPVHITTASPLPAATVGIAYSVTITAAGGLPPYTWSVNGFNVPNFTISTLTSTTATYGGTTQSQGIYAPSIHAVDANNVTATMLFNATVVKGSTSNTRAVVRGNGEVRNQGAVR